MKKIESQSIGVNELLHSPEDEPGEALGGGHAADDFQRRGGVHVGGAEDAGATLLLLAINRVHDFHFLEIGGDGGLAASGIEVHRRGIAHEAACRLQIQLRIAFHQLRGIGRRQGVLAVERLDAFEFSGTRDLFQRSHWLIRRRRAQANARAASFVFQVNREHANYE